VRTLLDVAHRWSGAVLGLLLAALGLSGTLLLWKAWWIGLPGARPGAAPDPAQTLALVQSADSLGARHLVLPSADFGLARIGLGGEAGAYLAPNGRVIARWTSSVERPELWLFDLHHELLLGEAGHTAVGFLGFAGLAFVVTGLLLWWPHRRRFEARALPRRLSRPAILRHHRDLGILAAPILVLLFLTGALLALRPVADVLLAPLSPRAEVEAWQSPPPPILASGPIDWPATLAAARAAFPEAAPRVLVWPARPGDPLVIRLRQPAEWHANGRTTLWFAPGSRDPVQVRDALAAPRAIAWFNAAWPLHAGLVGGLAYRLLLTAAGLALTLLGLLAAISFWYRPRARARHPA
jgi:uncharacterized iron-regulated membrane protein